MATQIAATAITSPKPVVIALDTVYTPPLRGIRCGASGNVAVKNINDTTITFTNVSAGEVLRGQISQVLTSGTTVASPTTNLVGLQ